MLLEALSSRGDPRVVARLRGVVVNGPQALRAEARRTLASCLDVAPTAEVAGYVTDLEPQISAAAATALGKRDTPEACDHLYEVARTGLASATADPATLAAQVGGLTQFTGAAVTLTLVTALSHLHPAVRAAAATALAGRSDPQARHALLLALTDREVEVCTAAASALGRWPGPPATLVAAPLNGSIVGSPITLSWAVPPCAAPW
jgi:HEAT repeats